MPRALAIRERSGGKAPFWVKRASCSFLNGPGMASARMAGRLPTLPVVVRRVVDLVVGGQRLDRRPPGSSGRPAAARLRKCSRLMLWQRGADLRVDLEAALQLASSKWPRMPPKLHFCRSMCTRLAGGPGRDARLSPPAASAAAPIFSAASSSVMWQSSPALAPFRRRRRPHPHGRSAACPAPIRRSSAAAASGSRSRRRSA